MFAGFIVFAAMNNREKKDLKRDIEYETEK